MQRISIKNLDSYPFDIQAYALFSRVRVRVLWFQVSISMYV
jgi:hypothetical protein